MKSLIDNSSTPRLLDAIKVDRNGVSSYRLLQHFSSPQIKITFLY